MNLNLIFQLLIIVIVTLAQITQKHGLFVIPGLGRADRLITVLSNLQILRPFLQSGWDCIIYIYAPRHDTDFWNSPYLTRDVYTACTVIEYPSQRFAENLRLVQPLYLHSIYQYVFILLDDIKLSNDFNLNIALRIMTRNNLTVASPRIVGANTGGGQKFRLIMQADVHTGTFGYTTSFLEVFACIMTVPAYEALWGLLFPSVNPFGWGYDMWYNCIGERQVKGHKMGIISAMTATHEQDLSTTGRADNASIEVKWHAVLKQEKFYALHYKIPLKKCRNKLRLKNKDWDGAVTGYLH